MGVKAESIGIFKDSTKNKHSSLDLIKRAASVCIAKSQYNKEDIGVIVNVSLYRDNYFAEPAFATFVQDALGINNNLETFSYPRTFSFDLTNGALGFLNACHSVGAMITTNKAKTGLIVSGDVLDLPIHQKSSLPEFAITGTAVILDNTLEGDKGFRSFFFKRFNDRLQKYNSKMYYDNMKLSMFFNKDPNIEEIYLDLISQAVAEYLAKEGVGIDVFDLIIPPQISRSFILKLADNLKVDNRRFVNVTADDGDLFTASTPTAMNYVMEHCPEQKGSKALIVNVGSGIQVGCAIYNF